MLGMSSTLGLSTDFIMDIKFKYQGCTLENLEAIALMKAAKAPQPFEVDLGKLIDIKVIDSQKLFKLSVEQQNPALANLAFKLATTEKKEFKVVVKAPTSAKVSKKQEPVTKTQAVDIVDYLNRKSCYRNAGATLLLHFCATTESRAIRDIAVEFANKCLSEYKIDPRSVVFRGFTKTKTGLLEPIETHSAVIRRDSFHVSPLYIALRAGLTYCDNNGLLSIRQQYSNGSHSENASAKADLMRRMFYTFKLTGKGNEVKETWGDMEAYLVKFFNSRHA